jgi:ABC-type nitrate/sulfonate/bicarbonate transport system substrate-binding protein
MDQDGHENPLKALVPVLAAGLILTVVVAQGSAAPASPPAKVNVVYAQPSAIFTPLFVAQDQGFFAKEGLEVGFTQATGTVAIATLMSGETQVLSTGATEVAGVDVAGGDVAMLAACSNYPAFSLYATPTIHSVEELAGKKVAVTTIGTSTDTTARIILEHYGLADKVEILSTGGTLAGVLAAMQAGIAAGGILSPPTTAKAEAAGFVELVNGLRLGVPMTQASIAVRKSYLAGHRDIVLRFMRAYLAAWAFIRNPAHEAAAEEAIAHYTRSTPDEAAVAYKALVSVWQGVTLPRVNPTGVTNVLRFSANTRVREVDPLTLIDDSVLDALVRSGYLDVLYPK